MLFAAAQGGLGSSSAFEQGAGHSRFPLNELPVEEREANENAMPSRASVRRPAALGQEQTPAKHATAVPL